MNPLTRQIALLTLGSLPFNSYAAVSLTQEQQLGQLLYNDKNLSFNRNQSCASCHDLKAATVDPVKVKKGTAVSKGSVAGKKGSLNAPMAAYAMHTPKFHWNEEQELYIGGQFWNGRATDLIAQAKGPFLNENEMAMRSEWHVVERLKEKPQYQKLFLNLYAVDLSTVPNEVAAVSKPAIIDEIYQKLATAIAAFEKSALFNKFNSKFDYALFGKTRLSAEEKKGLALFKGKAKCSACHTIDLTVANNGTVQPPLFTDFSYDNIGLPRNVDIKSAVDLGLGGRDDIDHPEAEVGKHKVMTLRNIALTAPYGHNGVLKTLEQVVHFYNTRDTLKTVVNNKHPEFATTAWASPEVADNVNRDELGDLKLSDDEEQAIVAFMKTLTDDYPVWGNDAKVPVGTPSPFNFSADSKE